MSKISEKQNEESFIENLEEQQGLNVKKGNAEKRIYNMHL